MATTKMFVYYSGTKAAFIAAGLETKYTNNIVFIKGGEGGTGAAVYTHGCYYANVEEALASLKYFGKIKAGDNVAQAAGPDGIITFTADDPASVAVKVDERGVHFALTDDFKTAVNTTLPNRITAIEDDYLKTADKTALQGEIASSLQSAKDYTDDKVSDIVGESNSALIGTAADAASADTIYGAKKYAEEKASAAQAAAEATAAADATSKVNAAKEEIKGTTDALDSRVAAIEDDYLKAADKTALQGNIDTLAGRVSANEAAIEIINGEGEGSIKKAAADAVAQVVAGADEDFDTLKEVAEWIAADTTGSAQMQADIATLKGADTVEGSVAKQVKDAVAAEAAIARAAEEANASAISGVDTRVKAIEDDYLKAADKTALQGNIDNVSAVANEAKSTADAVAADYLKKDDKDELQAAIDLKVATAVYEAKIAELEAMWGWEEL